MSEIQKKDISVNQLSWYIFLTCGFIIPILASFILNLLLKYLPTLETNFTFFQITTITFNILILWFGLKYYLKHAKTKYNFSDSKKLLKDCTITFLAWTILGLILFYFIQKPDVLSTFCIIIENLVYVCVWYLFLNKYLKD